MALSHDHERDFIVPICSLHEGYHRFSFVIFDDRASGVARESGGTHGYLLYAPWSNYLSVLHTFGFQRICLHLPPSPLPTRFRHKTFHCTLNSSWILHFFVTFWNYWRFLTPKNNLFHCLWEKALLTVFEAFLRLKAKTLPGFPKKPSVFPCHLFLFWALEWALQALR